VLSADGENDTDVWRSPARRPRWPSPKSRPKTIAGVRVGLVTATIINPTFEQRKQSLSTSSWRGAVTGS
jgi:hypothetical protein